MAIGEHKAVPIRPFEMRRIVLHQFVIEQIRNRGIAQRSSRVAAIRLFHRIHGKQPQGINGKFVDGEIREAGGHMSLCPLTAGPFDEIRRE